MQMETQLSSAPADNSSSGKTYTLAFAALCSLFFMWAIFNNFNDILIKHFQKALDLNRMQAGLVQSAFYFGYFSFALPAGYVIKKFGYKNAIIAGLLLASLGAMLFYPAATVREFWFFLLALYIIAAGLTFLETSVNPLAAIIGPPERAAFRLNLGASFNGLGTFLAPTLGGIFILSGVEYTPEQIASMSPAALAQWRADEALGVQTPYLVLAAILIGLVLIISRIEFPNVQTRTPAAAKTSDVPTIRLLEQKHFIFAVVAQFFYVGTQVGIWSYFINFAQDLTGMGEKDAAYGLTVSLTTFMIGRFVGTALIRRVKPALLLGIFGLLGALCCVLAMILSGYPALIAFGASSFFMSIGYPTIFALGVEGLGEKTNTAASCLVMSIIGGSIFPPIMGSIAQSTGSMQIATSAPLVGFMGVALYGFAMFRYKRTTGNA